MVSLVDNYAGYTNPIWKEGSPTGSTVTTPTAVTPSVTTKYYLLADTTNGCKDTLLVTITVNPVPTITNVVAASATCTNGIASSNAEIHVTGIASMTKYAYRTNGTVGLFANTATMSTATRIDLMGLANPAVATTYTVRIWGIDTTCFNDTTVVLNPAICPPCSVTATFMQNACNNNATTITGADDYFTVTVSAASATNGGTSGKYEVVLMPAGTVLNSGGTNYGTNVTVGSPGVFSSNGATTYQLKIRDMDISGCETTLFTTTASAACSTIACPPQICLPVTITRN